MSLFKKAKLPALNEYVIVLRGNNSVTVKADSWRVVEEGIVFLTRWERNKNKQLLVVAFFSPDAVISITLKNP